jgi:hypothetical protein
MTTVLALAEASLAATTAAETPPPALEDRPLAGQPNLHSLGVPENPRALAALLVVWSRERRLLRTEAAGATGAWP